MKSALVRLQEISEGRISLQNSDREFASFKITNNFSMGNLANLFASLFILSIFNTETCSLFLSEITKQKIINDSTLIDKIKL